MFLGTGIAGALIYYARWSFRSRVLSRIRYASLALVVFGGMVFLLVYVLVPCFDPFGDVICRGPTDQPVMALTFDDGPNEPYTSQILDILKRYQVPATFFVVGKHVRRYPEVARRIWQEGHEIGNHSWHHRPVMTMSRARIAHEVRAWEAEMASVMPPAFRPSRVFRAPHGWKTPLLVSVLKPRGYRLIGWTHGVWDSDQPGEAVLRGRLHQVLDNGAIILLHDGDGDRDDADRSQTVAVLPELIEFYRGQGYRFATVSSLQSDTDLTPAAKRRN